MKRLYQCKFERPWYPDETPFGEYKIWYELHLLATMTEVLCHKWLVSIDVTHEINIV